MRPYLNCLLILLCVFPLSLPLTARADETIRMVFVGDLMLDEQAGQMIARGRDPFAPFAELFRRADISIGNFETALGNKNSAQNRAAREKKPYTFMAHPRVLPVVKKHFSAVVLANNHTGDYGPQGVERMLNLLDQAGVRHFGAGRNWREAHMPILFEAKGKKVAMLAYSMFLPRSFEALEDRAGSAWGDKDYIAWGIRHAREKLHADYVIVIPHWGWEYEKFASPAQKHMAEFMLDQGADAVVGGHPHVTQNIQIYDGKPIFYSLGNFVFNGFEDEDANTGWLLELSLGPQKSVSWRVFEARLDKNGLPRNRGLAQETTLK